MRSGVPFFLNVPEYAVPMIMNRAFYFCLPIFLSMAFLLMMGCGSTNQLQQYDFDGARIAVVAAIPPHPTVFSDLFFDARVNPDDPLGSVFRAGTALAKQGQVRAAQTRMDSALRHIDIAERIAEDALVGGAPYLGYRPENNLDRADYILDLRVENYGLVADSWDAVVHFEIDAELLLVDRRTRQVIWKKHLRSTEPLSAAPLGLGTTFGNVFTASALAGLSVEEMVDALDHLAAFTANRFVAVLRHDFYESRAVGTAAR